MRKPEQVVIGDFNNYFSVLWCLPEFYGFSKLTDPPLKFTNLLKVQKLY